MPNTTDGFSVSAETLIQSPLDLPPHVVVLGAGASLSACPAGDRSGRRLPVMNNLLDTLGLRPLFTGAAAKHLIEGDFEATYANLSGDPGCAAVADDLERNVFAYFAEMRLPDSASDYDRLVMSLRQGDAIFTFNWDPFLFDAWMRAPENLGLPSIYFLHGNVRVGFCKHGTFGRVGARCPTGGDFLQQVPLLYPVTEKNYSRNPYIAGAWDAAGQLLEHALTITIFGYGAPVSDRDAVDILKRSWLRSNNRRLDHLEVIDIAKEDDLRQRWTEMIPTGHLLPVARNFRESRFWKWPRRTREAVHYPSRHGQVCYDFPLPDSDDLQELREYCQSIARHEPSHASPST